MGRLRHKARLYVVLMLQWQLMPSLKSAHIWSSELGFSNPSLFEEEFESSE